MVKKKGKRKKLEYVITAQIENPFKRDDRKEVTAILDSGTVYPVMLQEHFEELFGKSLKYIIPKRDRNCVLAKTIGGLSILFGGLSMNVLVPVEVKKENKTVWRAISLMWYFIPDTSDEESVIWFLQNSGECIKELIERLRKKIASEIDTILGNRSLYQKYRDSYGLEIIRKDKKAKIVLKKGKIISEIVSDWNETAQSMRVGEKSYVILPLQDIISDVEKEYSNVRYSLKRKRIIADEYVGAWFI